MTNKTIHHTIIGMFSPLNKANQLNQIGPCLLAQTHKADSSTKPASSFGQAGFSFGLASWLKSSHLLMSGHNLKNGGSNVRDKTAPAELGISPGRCVLWRNSTPGNQFGVQGGTLSLEQLDCHERSVTRPLCAISFMVRYDYFSVHY